MRPCRGYRGISGRSNSFIAGRGISGCSNSVLWRKKTAQPREEDTPSLAQVSFKVGTTPPLHGFQVYNPAIKAIYQPIIDTLTTSLGGGYIQDGDLHLKFAVQILHQVVEQTLQKTWHRKVTATVS